METAGPGTDDLRPMRVGVVGAGFGSRVVAPIFRQIGGDVVDVDCAVGSAPCLTASDDGGYEIDEADVAYWGRCPQCQAQGLETTRLTPSTLRRRLARVAGVTGVTGERDALPSL